MTADHATAAARRRAILERIAHAAPGRDPQDCLLAVGKRQPVEALRALAAAGQKRFGENYVQEAASKREALADLRLEWHLIGPLQSNKCRLAAATFDWIHTLDRPKLVPLLGREREAGAALNVLIQVNVDDEDSKSGCAPDAIGDLADAIAAQPGLRLRGLMAIPAPHPDLDLRRGAFAAMRAHFEALRALHPAVDTLSMGMSDDFEIALAEGATLVRIGTALFGPRPRA
jgi:pyridoxal phosphate enzyme (YggS family)